MNWAGVCSGISAPAVAWAGLGWQCQFEAEIDAFPNAVRHHHWPDVPNFGDMNGYREWPDARINLLIGGTPCQSFSIAGLRAGMDDPRGNLALGFIGVVDRYRPGWVVWENVPGVFSSGEGRDFEAFIRGMAEIGYYGAWRVLDAQWFGVAQRRRRTFAIFCPGDWRPAAAVLLEPESLRGDPPPSRETRKETSGTLRSRSGGGCGPGPDDAAQGNLIPMIANPLTARMHKGINTTLDEGQTPIVTHALTGEGFDASEDGTGRGTPLVPVGFNAKQDPDSWNDRTGPLATDGGMQAVAFSENQQAKVKESDVTRAINTGGGKPGQGYPAIRQGLAVRRLTPRECERLQGFPDDFTLIPWRGKPAGKCPDGPRYKALGNSMAVPVVRWIGERIAIFEEDKS